MPVPMMDVGVVGMLVRQHLVPMRMHVRFGAVPREIVLMPVMIVVVMLMRVRERFVCVLVLVPLAHVQPDAQPHQRSGGPEER